MRAVLDQALDQLGDVNDAAHAVAVVLLGHKQAGVAARDADLQRALDVVVRVDGHYGGDRRHHLACLLLVQVEDAGEHPGLAGVDVAAGI